MLAIGPPRPRVNLSASENRIVHPSAGSQSFTGFGAHGELGLSEHRGSSGKAGGEGREAAAEKATRAAGKVVDPAATPFADRSGYATGNALHLRLRGSKVFFAHGSQVESKSVFFQLMHRILRP